MILQYFRVLKFFFVSETLLYVCYYTGISVYFLLTSFWFNKHRSNWTDGEETKTESEPCCVLESQELTAQETHSSDENILAGDGARKFSLEGCPKDEWTSWPIWRKTRGEGTKYEVHVYRSDRNDQAICRDGVQYPPSSQSREYWYHATDRDSAADILKHGVRLEFGRGMQDFSHKDGFYVSPLYKNAVNWACNQTREHPAIIIFKLQFQLEIFRKLDLNSSYEEWEMIIKYNRSGRQASSSKCPLVLDPNLLERFEGCEYVIGPVNGGKAGVRSNTKDWNSWKPSGFQRPHQQLCVRSQRLTEVLSDIRNVDAVIFYS